MDSTPNTETVESFNDFNTAPAIGAENENTNSPELDTFDSPAIAPEDIKLSSEKAEENPTKTKKEDTLEEGETSLLESQEEKKEEEAKEEESEDKQEESKESEEESIEEKPEGKKLTGKLGDEKFELDTDMEIGVKVDGKRTTATIQDLINNYSGKIAFDKKFTEVDQIRQEAEAKFGEAEQAVEQFERAKQKISDDLIEIVTALDNAEGDPLQGVYKLLAFANRNPLEFEQRVFSQLQEQFENFQDMDETERRLYWREKELEYYKQQTQSSREDRANTETRTRQLQAIDYMRETAGVSKEAFTQAHGEIAAYYKQEGIDLSEMTAEEVVEHAVMTPFYDQADEIIDVYKDIIPRDNLENVYEAVAAGLVEGLSQEEVKEIIEEDYGNPDQKAVKEKLQSLPKKLKRETKQYAAPSNPEKPESFDDFTNYEYGY